MLRGSKQAREARRMMAVELFEQGMPVTEIAERLGVTHSAVSHWKKAYTESGVEGLRSIPHPGGTSRLSEENRNRLAEMLAEGPAKHGFSTELWTLSRVGKLIEKNFGTTFHDSQVSRILKQMKWSPQKPEFQAKEKDEKKVEEWRNEQWPAIKKKQR